MGFLSDFFEFSSPTNQVGELGLASETDSSTDINPATGLSMLDGMGSVDVAGNPFGTDLGESSNSAIDSSIEFIGSSEDLTSSFDSFSSFNDPF